MKDSPNASSQLLEVNSTHAVFSMPKIIQFFAILTITSFYLTLILGCGYLFICKDFLPSPHYLGSFLGFNRFNAMSFVLLSVTMGCLYVGIYFELYEKSGLVERSVFKYVGIANCAILPVIALTNDVNTSHIISFPITNAVLSYCCLVLNAGWVVLVFWKIRSRIEYAVEYKRCKIYLACLLINWLLVIVERKLNYQTENWFINTRAWSGLEWVLLKLSIGFIIVLGKVTGKIEIMIDKEKREEKEEAQIELSEVLTS
jgi:hypothetical protein